MNSEHAKQAGEASALSLAEVIEVLRPQVEKIPRPGIRTPPGGRTSRGTAPGRAGTAASDGYPDPGTDA
jgi:hypothetical protein